MHPRRPQDPHKMLQDASKAPQDVPKTLPRRPKTLTRRPQDAPKTPQDPPRRSPDAPRRPKTPPRRPQDVLRPFLGSVFEPNRTLNGTEPPPRRPQAVSGRPPDSAKKGSSNVQKGKIWEVLRQTSSHILGALRTERMQFRRAWLLFCSECLRLHLAAAAAGRFNLWVELSIRLRDKFLPGWPRGKCTRRSEVLQEACSELPLPLGAGTV